MTEPKIEFKFAWYAMHIYIYIYIYIHEYFHNPNDKQPQILCIRSYAAMQYMTEWNNNNMYSPVVIKHIVASQWNITSFCGVN